MNLFKDLTGINVPLSKPGQPVQQGTQPANAQQNGQAPSLANFGLGTGFGFNAGQNLNQFGTGANGLNFGNLSNNDINNDVCLVKYNLKVEEVEFLKKTLNNTQTQLNQLNGNMVNGGQNSTGQIQNLQKIIDELNNKLSASTSK